MTRNFTNWNISQETTTDSSIEIVIPSAFVIFWMAVFMGFIFSLVITFCLLFTKEVQRGNVYITLSTMTLSELVVYLTFLILLGMSTFPRMETYPYLCLLLNTIVGLFKAYSLSLAIYLSAERVVALSCPKLYRVTSKRNPRHVVQTVLFVLDATFYFSVNFYFGSKDTDAACSAVTVYPGEVYMVMSILRASAIPKMVIVLILSATTRCLIRKKMRKIIDLSKRSKKSKSSGSRVQNPDTGATFLSNDQGPSSGSTQRNQYQNQTREQETCLQSVTDVVDQNTHTASRLCVHHGVERESDKMASLKSKSVTRGILKNPMVNPKTSSSTSQRGTEISVSRETDENELTNSSTPVWMKESFKTLSNYLLSYIIVYLPSITYMTVMVCFPDIKEDVVSRGINFLTPCVHSIVASFLYIYKIKELNQKFRCRCLDNICRA